MTEKYKKHFLWSAKGHSYSTTYCGFSMTNDVVTDNASEVTCKTCRKAAKLDYKAPVEEKTMEETVESLMAEASEILKQLNAKLKELSKQKGITMEATPCNIVNGKLVSIRIDRKYWL